MTGVFRKYIFAAQQSFGRSECNRVKKDNPYSEVVTSLLIRDHSLRKEFAPNFKSYFSTTKMSILNLWIRMRVWKIGKPQGKDKEF